MPEHGFEVEGLVGMLHPYQVMVATYPTGYLVDPASSHMLVSKIKPCMFQYKHLFGKTAHGSLKQL